MDPARPKLLAVPGIGRETADSIVLYAAGLPLFVVDAYTRRVFSRLGLLADGEPGYDEVQRFFMARAARGTPRSTTTTTPRSSDLGKDVCRPRPRCQQCPLEALCPRRGVA